MVGIMIDPATLGTALCTRILAISTSDLDDDRIIQECYYSPLFESIPDFSCFCIVQKVSANPTQYIGMAINSFVFQVDVCVKLIAERTDATLIASEVANTLMSNIADNDFETDGAWLCIVRDSGTQEVLQLDDEINDAYIHENFFVEMKEDQIT